MATISFYGNVTDETQDLLDHNAGSGIGFFGSSWGVPVALTETQQTTWVVTEDGGDYGSQLNNNQYVTTGNTLGVAGTVKINGAAPSNLDKLPNALATLNIRFEHETPVIASQPSLIIFDRESILNPAVDVITYVYEVRHPLVSSTATNLSHRASSNNMWTIFEAATGEPEAMPLTNSPGPSGLNTSAVDTAGGTNYRAYLEGEGLNPDDYNKGSAGEFLRHDWFVALSSSPTDIGQKTEYGLYFTVDYL